MTLLRAFELGSPGSQPWLMVCKFGHLNYTVHGTYTPLMTENFLHHSRAVPSILHDLVRQLSQDSSHEVRSYVAELSLRYKAGDSDVSLASSTGSRKRLIQLATFSRPPPVPSLPSLSPSGSTQRPPSESSGTPGRTYSSSSAEASSINCSDSIVGHREAGVWSLSSPDESGQALDDTHLVPSEGSKHVADPPPNNVLVSANGVYQPSFPDMEGRYVFEFDDGTRNASASGGMIVPG